MHSKGALSGNLPQRSFVILTYGFFPRGLQRYQLRQPRFIRTANLPQHMRRIPIRRGMIDKAERRGHHIRKRRPLRVIRHRADAEHAQHRIHRANRDKFIQKPLVAILKRELLKEHVIDQRMLKENRPIRRDLVQMTGRARISFLAPVRAGLADFL